MSKYVEAPPESHIIYQPLTKPSMMLGIPSRIVYTIGFVGLQSVLFLQTWKLLPICILLFCIAQKYTKEDPYFDQVYEQYNKSIARYR